MNPLDKVVGVAVDWMRSEGMVSDYWGEGCLTLKPEERTIRVDELVEYVVGAYLELELQRKKVRYGIR